MPEEFRLGAILIAIALGMLTALWIGLEVSHRRRLQRRQAERTLTRLRGLMTERGATLDQIDQMQRQRQPVLAIKRHPDMHQHNHQQPLRPARPDSPPPPAA